MKNSMQKEIDAGSSIVEAALRAYRRLHATAHHPRIAITTWFTANAAP